MRLTCSLSLICLQLILCLIAQNAFALLNNTDSNSTEVLKAGNITNLTEVLKLGNSTNSTVTNSSQVDVGVFAKKMSVKCSNDDACSSDQWCIEGSCADCESSEDCEWRYICNWNNMCQFGCKSSKDCPDEEVCSNGKCAECKWDGDCNSASVCISGQCKAKETIKCGWGVNCNSWQVQDFVKYVRKTMSDENIPTTSVLVFNGTKIMFEGLFGSSDLEKNIRLKENHPFLIASISKVVTTVALLQLMEKHSFGLNTHINDILDFDVDHPLYSRKITVKMLLTHTAAITESWQSKNLYSYGKDSPIGLKYLMKEYFTPGGKYYEEKENFHNWAPGSKFEYSNMGSALIGVLVEEVSGQNFDEYCKENIFKPLGMTNTAWHLKDINGPIVMPYEYDDGDWYPIGHFTFPDYPNGGLRSTAKDMFKFYSAFTQNGWSNGFQLMKPETLKQMLTLQIPDINKLYGLMIYLEDPDQKIWGHNGGEMGVSTNSGFKLSSKIGVIVLANLEDVDTESIMYRAFTRFDI